MFQFCSSSDTGRIPPGTQQSQAHGPVSSDTVEGLRAMTVQTLDEASENHDKS
jgi:hypothetical protein